MAFFKRMNGFEGAVDIPAIGAVVGTMGSWTLTQREDVGPLAGLYDLRAVFSYVNPALFNAEGLNKRIKIRVSRKLQFRLDIDPSGRTVLEGMSLLVEGVKLCPLEP